MNHFFDVIKKFPFTGNSTKIANGKSTKAKPFIQWVGGKREMIPHYNKYLPKKFGVYYEPFLGGGALFFYLNPAKAVLGDSNLELIKTYEGVRNDPRAVIILLQELKRRHSKKLYLAIRGLDRRINILDKYTNEEIAARFIYLNQTCFNGVYRVNQMGQFNVPIGSSLNRLICDEGTLINSAKLLRKARIMCGDFQFLTKDARRNDFVYLDPPYFPISKYSDFTRYTKEKFSKSDQIRVRDTFRALNRRGCQVMLSNSDSPFIRSLYKEFPIRKFYSGRALNSKKDRRGKVTELLITNY